MNHFEMRTIQVGCSMLGALLVLACSGNDSDGGASKADPTSATSAGSGTDGSPTSGSNGSTDSGSGGASSSSSGSGGNANSNGSGGGNSAGSGGSGDVTAPLPEASCEATAEAAEQVAEPEFLTAVSMSGSEAWLGSPGIADLDDDGTIELVVPRDGTLNVVHLDGTSLLEASLPGRIWAPPVVADLRPEIDGLEVAVASRERIQAWDAQGNTLSGFPFDWRDEMRSLATADIDDDGRLELVAVTTSDLDANGQTDILIAVNDDGSQAKGFPPNTTGASGCDDACFVHAGYDQNVALGDVNDDGVADILAPQDNAYVSLHEGNGNGFDSNSIFEVPTKFMGIRFLHDYSLAQQGWGPDDADQAHFTNTAPAIVDVDGDGTNEIVMLGSVQNIAQDDRERGVALWVVENDGTRPDDWLEPFHAPDFIDGLWDAGDNIVGATNQVTVVDLDPEREGYEFVFAGFDGRIHAVDSHAQQIWQTTFTTEVGVLTGGVLAVDLSQDGRPEIVFNTYSTADGQSTLFVLGSNGEILHEVTLPGRGAMPVPSIGDVDQDGSLEIVVSLKDDSDGDDLLVYTVPGSSDNCMPWPTGRGNLWRNGTVRNGAAQ